MPGSKAEAVFERPVPVLGRSAMLALVMTAILMVAWESWVRSEGVKPAYRNSDGQWTEQRRRINNGAGDGWVFTGSSRVLFNMQLSVWERLDKRRPLQLALEGTAPVAVMESLDSGKTIFDCETVDVPETIHCLKWYAEAIDKIHTMGTRDIPGAKPPRFTMKTEGPKTLVVHYQSDRGLIDFAIGLARGVGKHYGEAMTVTKQTDDQFTVVFE